jgi:hypothetical protein
MFIYCVSHGVPIRNMRCAINLDDQALLGAEEVRDAIADYVLPSELVAAQLGATEVAPKPDFKRRRCVAQSLRSTDQVRVLLQSVPHPLPLP